MKLIPLSRGLFAKVDDEDYENLSEFKWHARDCKGKFYAVRSEWKNKKNNFIYLHRFIMNPSSDMKVDHINRDGLDCQRSNMRICTHSQNLQNCFFTNIKNRTSKFKGVGFHNHSKLWRARIREGKKEKVVGYFKDEASAVIAYNDAAFKAFGEFAYLNRL